MAGCAEEDCGWRENSKGQTEVYTTCYMFQPRWPWPHFYQEGPMAAENTQGIFVKWVALVRSAKFSYANPFLGPVLLVVSDRSWLSICAAFPLDPRWTLAHLRIDGVELRRSLTWAPNCTLCTRWHRKKVLIYDLCSMENNSVFWGQGGQMGVIVMVLLWEQILSRHIRVCREHCLKQVPAEIWNWWQYIRHVFLPWPSIRWVLVAVPDFSLVSGLQWLTPILFDL